MLQPGGRNGRLRLDLDRPDPDCRLFGFKATAQPRYDLRRGLAAAQRDGERPMAVYGPRDEKMDVVRGASQLVRLLDQPAFERFGGARLADRDASLVSPRHVGGNRPRLHFALVNLHERATIGAGFVGGT